MDVGANIGYVGCSLLHGIPDYHVVAIEPQPPCFALLKENLEAVGGGRAQVINAALSDRPGTAKMRLVEGNTGKGHLLFDGVTNLDGAPIIEVPMISGMQLLEKIGGRRIDLIKIDVEGHEQAVLTTLQPLMREQRPRVVVFEHSGDLNSPNSEVIV